MGQLVAGDKLVVEFGNGRGRGKIFGPAKGRLGSNTIPGYYYLESKIFNNNF